jgi:hypothetical protein
VKAKFAQINRDVKQSEGEEMRKIKLLNKKKIEMKRLREEVKSIETKEYVPTNDHHNLTECSTINISQSMALSPALYMRQSPS